MRFFIKNDLKWDMVNFKPEEHPYPYHPGFPIRHGLLKTGEIDWGFWLKQETWTFDQAVRLLDDTRTGDDTYCDHPWPLYQKISDGLMKALNASAAHHIFKGKPNTRHGFIRQSSVVYPAPFIEWAFHNGCGIPDGLRELLPVAIKKERGWLAPEANNTADEEPPLEVAADSPPPVPADQSSLAGWIKIYEWHRDHASDPDDRDCWAMMALRLEGMTGYDIYQKVLPHKVQQVEIGTAKAHVSRSIKTRGLRLLKEAGLPALPQLLPGKKGKW
jgi:hypothetical protein